MITSFELIIFTSTSALYYQAQFGPVTPLRSQVLPTFFQRSGDEKQLVASHKKKSTHVTLQVQPIR